MHEKNYYCNTHTITHNITYMYLYVSALKALASEDKKKMIIA